MKLVKGRSFLFFSSVLLSGKTNKMKKTITKFLIFFVIFSLVVIDSKKLQAASIWVSGSWSETIDASDLQAHAGSDLIDSYESASKAIFISITAFNRNWQVNVKRIDTNWQSNLHLHVKRTSNGAGTGSISGGTSYQEVTEADQSFFSGFSSRYSISLQLKLSNVSVQIPPGNYTTTVYYTVVEQ